MRTRILLTTMAIIAMGWACATYVGAQEDPESPLPPQQAPAQAPTQAQTAAGRISVLRGNVSLVHGDSGESVEATVNTPVVPGDKVTTADKARAELQLDAANVMRLEEHTEARVADLEANKLDVQLASGLVDFTVFNGTQADAEVDTPNMGVHPLSPGIYRIQVTSPSETILIVRKGEAEVLTNQGSTKVEAGQIIQIHGTDNPEYKIDAAPKGDEFDKWCSDRDHQMQSVQAQQHTGPEVTGSGDLDYYGQWQEVPDYGWCWTPQVDAGWVPYSAGRWAWEPYWGWTWVSYEPWGWAPYHYGRWFMYGGRWAWWPARGYYGPHPVWAPAYVSFFGFGGGGFGFGVGFGFGSIGWLALGPRDICHPWWGGGHSYNVVNINNLNFHGPHFTTPGGRPYGSNLEQAMTDARMRNAIMHVSAQDFASGRMTRSTPVSESMLRSANMVHGSLPVTPTQASLGNRAGSFQRSTSGAMGSEHFYSRGGVTTAGHSYNFSSDAGQVRNMVQRGPTSDAQMNRQMGGNTESYGARSNSTFNGRTETAQPGAQSSNGGWRGYQQGNQSQRWPAAVNGPSTSSPGKGAPASQNNPYNWQRFASPNPYSSGRTASGSTAQRGGWQGSSSAPRSYSGGSSGWNAPAPRSGGSYTYSGGSRPSLELNRPIMRERAPSGGYYGGGARNSSAPSGGGRTYSAPSGGGSHSSSASHSSGGGGGGHSSGGGGGHHR